MRPTRRLILCMVLSPGAILGFITAALACTLVPYYHSLTKTGDELRGFIIARPIELITHGDQSYRTLRLKVLQWIGPENSDTLVTVRHYSHQGTLMDHWGVGADCSELAGRQIQYLIPLYFRARWGDTTTSLVFPALHEILGRTEREDDSIAYSRFHIHILDYFYHHGRSPIRMTISAEDNRFSTSHPASLHLTVFNESDTLLPLPPAAGFDLHVRAFKNRSLLFHWFGISPQLSEVIDYPWPVLHSSDSVLSAGDSAARVLNIPDRYRYLVDSLRARGADSISIFAKLNWTFDNRQMPFYAGLSAFSDTIGLKVDDVTSVSSLAEAVSLVLHQNYPNPFNPATEIRYQISEVSQVTLKVYDVLGREVATLVNGEQEAGTYRVRWDAAGLPSGVYVYRVQANEYVETMKMVLMR